MSKTVNAQVEWVPFEEGGRKNRIPIKGEIRYSPIIVFEGQDISFEAWSTIIYALEHINDCTSIIQLTYGSPEAPFSYLVSGNKFKLFEGVKLVATGVIL